MNGAANDSHLGKMLSLSLLQMSSVVSILKCALMRGSGSGSKPPVMDGDPATSVSLAVSRVPGYGVAVLANK